MENKYQPAKPETTFWREQKEMMLSRIVETLKQTGQPVTAETIRQFILTLSLRPEMIEHKAGG